MSTNRFVYYNIRLVFVDFSCRICTRNDGEDDDDEMMRWWDDDDINNSSSSPIPIGRIYHNYCIFKFVRTGLVPFEWAPNRSFDSVETEWYNY